MTHALSVLEFGSILDRLAQFCETAPGATRALALRPSFHEPDVRTMHDETREAVALEQTDLPSLRGVVDVSDFVKVAKKGSTLRAEDIATVGVVIRAMAAFSEKVGRAAEVAPTLSSRATRIPQLTDLGARIADSVDRDGTVLDQASRALGDLRSQKASLARSIVQKIEKYTTGPSRSLLSDTVTTQRSGRYVIPLKAENRGKIRGIVHDTSASGQTIFIEPQDVVEVGNKLREVEAAEKAEIERILKALSAAIGAEADSITVGIDVCAELDLVLSKARYGLKLNAISPKLVRGPTMTVVAGRHPLLDPETAVPLSMEIGGQIQGLVITGPNTGGKTVAMKTVGLFAAMNQCGMLLPAEHVTIGFFTQLWADIGDEQSLQQSLSTFGGHIKNVSEALRGVREGALVVLDEVGAGTDPAEGAALAVAILLEFQAKGAVVMASTHYGELKLFASNTPGFVNASMEFDLKTLRPTYRFQMGTPGASHAMKIARRYGVPDPVIAKAEEGFSQSEQDIAVMLEKLETAQKQAQRAQSEADRLAGRLRQVEAEAERKLAQAEEARRTVRQRAVEELEELLRQIRIEAAEAIDEVKKGGSIDAARKKLSDLQTVGSEFARELRPERKKLVTDPKAVVPGARVKIVSLGLNGTVQSEPKDGKVTVQAGMIRTQVKLSDIEVVGAPEPVKPSRPKKVSAKVRLSKAQTAVRELHLRQMRAEEALEKLDLFLDDALIAGIQTVRIVHGKGEGVLRKVTQEFLRRHAHVASFADATAEEGGQGVTVAHIQ